MQASALFHVTLNELRAAVSRGEASGAEVAAESVGRAHAWQPRINAFTEVAESAWSPAGGPLSGVPIAVKDAFVDRDRIPTAGSNVGGHWLRGTATVLQRLRRAGATVMGYTNMHEWGLDCTSAVTATGPVRNPWAPDHIAGGSSGGSAAALAAGTVAGAVGSDAAGSIRIPAACCGVVGLKPSWGRVPLDGFVDDGSPVDHAGPMARSVADVRVLFEVLAGSSVAAVEVGSLRLGVAEGFFFDHLDSGVGDAMTTALARLSRLVESTTKVEIPGAAEAMRGIARLFVPPLYDRLAGDLEARPDAFQPETRTLLLTAAAITPADRAEGEAIRERALRAWAEIFSTVDVIVSPTLSSTPPTIAACRATYRTGAAMPTIPYLRLNAPMNLAGIPALSLPCGEADGWTVSITMSAAHGRDDVVLALGEALEGAFDGAYRGRVAALPEGSAQARSG
jgi:aspartyl-tRNA(Asn)/glutamyl-tRNA(Gln) amidotransferase subunit A